MGILILTLLLPFQILGALYALIAFGFIIGKECTVEMLQKVYR